MTLDMKIFQPLFVVLVVALTALTFTALSSVSVAAPSTVLALPHSGTFELAVDDVEATLTQVQICPCPTEKNEIGCGLDLCSSGILQSNLPESRQLAVTPNPILRDDLTGIADEPDYIPPRPLV